MAFETSHASTICRMVSEGLGVSLLNPIVSRTMRLPGIVAVPFKPDVPFKSYMLRAQLAPRDTHVNFIVSCMKAAFKSF